MISDAQTQTLFEKFKALFTGEQATALSTVTAERDALKAQVETAKADLVTARQAGMTATSEVTRLTAELATAKAAQTTIDAKALDDAAAKKAAALAAAAGQPPLKPDNASATDTASGEELITKLVALQKDPAKGIEATTFYRTHAKAIDAAYSARQ